MKDHVGGWDAGKALVEAGIAPKQCTEIVVRFTASRVVEIQTTSFMTPEDWEKTKCIIMAARDAGVLKKKHAYVKAGTDEVVESA